MSRIGKHPVPIPSGVDVAIAGQSVKVKGKLGELSQTLPPDVEVGRDGDSVVVKPREGDGYDRAMWGLSRTLVDNMVRGVSEGFTQTLEITGVGYRAAMEGGMLSLQLGYSHDIRLAVPDGIRIECPKPTTVTVTGSDRQRVGQIAAEIRALRKPEPYKGKGVRYEGEYIRRKEGKKK